MRTLGLTALLVFGLGLFIPTATRGQPGRDAKRLAELMAQLGSERYAERQQASAELDALGPAALEALRQAAQSNDPEVRRRAAELVQRIEKRLDTTRLLGPSKVRWVYQDAPVAEIVADIAKKSGLSVELEGDRSRLADRKVSLDTGETIFWQAWDQFCVKAGLVEPAPAPPPVRRNRGNSISINGNQVIINGVPLGGPIGPKDVLRPAPSEPPANRLAVTDGKPPALPTHYAGDLRVRALPPGTDLPGQTRTAGEALFGLEVTAGPKLQCRRVLGVRVQRALDDQGQPLTQRLTPPNKPSTPSGGGVIMINGMVLNTDPPEPVGYPPRQTPVRLGLSEKPSRSIQELAGTVIALVQSPPETLATVDNILKAADRTVPGGAGSSVKVLEVARQENGQVRLRVVVVAPPSKISDGSGQAGANAFMAGGNVVIGGVGGGMGNNGGGSSDELLTAANFALVDDQGQPFETVKAINKGGRAGEGQELELVYQPRQGQGEAARFVFTGPRSAIIEVPFTLKNVPLP